MPNNYYTMEDLKIRAQKRIPQIVFDYLDGGAGTEQNIRRNILDFEEIILQPEYLRNVVNRSQDVTLFGNKYNAPIGISPMGLANLIWPSADRTLAKLAKERNIPYLLSAVGTTSIEDITKIAPDNTWFQLYVPGKDDVCFDLVRRAKEAGIRVLVLTVDIPEPSIRPRDLRNDFKLPFNLKLKTVLDILTKPKWAATTLYKGIPRFENMVPYFENTEIKKSLGAAQILQVSARVSEDLIKKIRDSWDHTFIIKGILSPQSAKAALRVGADGIIVSNHGGRQLDCGPSSISALPRIVEATNKKIPIMLDSGIRSGGDIVKSFALGASFTFSGRPFMYGLGALNEAGAEYVIEKFTDEVDKMLAQIGCIDIKTLDEEYIWDQNI